MGRTGWAGDTGVNFLTTAVWKAIASPGDNVAMPTLSSLRAEHSKHNPGGYPFEAIQSLWNAVFQMAVTSLGWPSPALGFLRWREAGYPAEDPRLEVIARLLGDDLDAHSAEALLFLFEPHCWGRHLTAGESEARDRMLAERRPAWLDRYMRSNGDHPAPSPFWGGNDALHMQAHVPIVGLESMGVPTHHVTDQSTAYLGDGAAVLMLDEYPAWYRKLARFGSSLEPRPDGRSWRIDVVVKPVGWIGSYRRSRLTGRWFSGPHSIHEWGSLRT